MKQSIKERLHALRMTFHPNQIKALIIPSTDPHLSEYVAPHWMSREWISGFTGSAGTVVVLMDKNWKVVALQSIRRCCQKLQASPNFSAGT